MSQQSQPNYIAYFIDLYRAQMWDFLVNGTAVFNLEHQPEQVDRRIASHDMGQQQRITDIYPELRGVGKVMVTALAGTTSYQVELV